MLEKLGAGGMGEVYLAEDTRLDRKVALKILPEHLAERADLRERFEREARAVSSLNHPHICTLHDIGEQDGIHYLVMEHLEGQTLAERLEKGPLPLEEALEYAIQIADALDKAHRQGVVHRDLKPGNIMLTKGGAKLLDFGLAKLQAADSPSNLSAMPTEQASLTAEGTILGTLQYMAPEQLEGKEVDARTDIFAFGAVVYEMVTGKKAFEGKSQASLIAAIMQSDPRPMMELEAMTPPALDRVVRKCLAKKQEERWQSFKDLHDELKWISEGGAIASGQAEVAAIAPQPVWRRAAPLVLAGVVITALVSLAMWNLRSSSQTPLKLAHVTIPLPSGDRMSGLDFPALALSRDGTRLAYVANRGGHQQIFIRSLHDPEAIPIAGTEGGYNPFFSPDGRWLGFFVHWNIKKVPLSGGLPEPLMIVPPVTRGASWGLDDTIFFTSNPNGPLSFLSASGQENVGWYEKPLAATSLNHDNGEFSHRWPEVLPGGQAVLFTTDTGGSFDAARIALLDLETGQTKVVLEGGTNPRYARSGHIVFARSGQLLAAPFDLERMEVDRDPVTVVANVAMHPEGAAQFALSEDGTLVYISGETSPPLRRLVWADRQGKIEPLPTPPRSYMNPALSPDGQQLVVTIAEGSNYDVWVSEVSRGTLTRLTYHPGEDFNPVWTPDGEKITFSSELGKTSPQLFQTLADGSGNPEKLTQLEGERTVLEGTGTVEDAGSYSPDGQFLAYVHHQYGVDLDKWTQSDLWILSVHGEPSRRPFLETPFNEYAPSFSPDGRWLAYVSDESGRDEIYVQPFPGPGGKVQVSIDGGTDPIWARSGREIFFRNGNEVMSVEVAAQPNFTASRPQTLFEMPYGITTRADSWSAYDVDAASQRFLMIQEVVSDSETNQINVILNWFEELKRLVPTDN